MTEWYEYLTSEDGRTYVGYLWNAAWFVIGGGLMGMVNRLRSCWPKPKPELVTILDAIKTATQGTVTVLGPADPVTAERRQTALACLRLANSNIAVRYDADPYKSQGVIYLSGEDQSDLHDVSELRQVVRAAADRWKEIKAEDRTAARRLLAESIPRRKA